MAFAKSEVDQAWNRANGHCERCGKQLAYANRGREGCGCWEAHHKNRSKGDILSNCEIVCFSFHTQTSSFGR